MPEISPVMMDGRGDNTVVRSLRRLVPNLWTMDTAVSVLVVGELPLLEVP